MTVTADNAFFAGRKRRNAFRMLLCLLATVFGLTWLVLILISLVWNGVQGLTPQIFYQPTPPPHDVAGGLANAIIGSVLLTFIGIAIGGPIGILAGTYMAEYGRNDRLTSVIRFINDILLSAPSIIIGLFVYSALVLPWPGFSAVADALGWHGSSGIAGSIALAIIAIPVVVRTTEDMLLLVPNPTREAASALGFPRSMVIRSVSYRAARTGLITGLLLAVARISGETAPLLFTAANSLYFGIDLTKPIANLPVTINTFINNPDPNWKQLAWTGALLITAAVLVLSVAARMIGGKETK